MAKRPHRRRRIVLIVLGLLALTVIVLHLPVPPPKLKVGPKTTVINGPLRPDGTVDYAAALEAEAAKGVTADNNAAIPLLRVLGPRIIEDPAVRARALKKLGLSDLPEDGDYFVSVKDWAAEGRSQEPASRKAPLDYEGLCDQLAEATASPWAPAEYPELARWLADNDGALDRLAEATGRNRYYLPVLGDPPDLLVSKSTREPTAAYADGARALACRAMRRARAGQTDRAWQDILAVYRLARLTAQSPLLTPQLVANVMETLGAGGGSALGAAGTLTRGQAVSMLADLQALPPLPPLANTLDGSERFSHLDAMVQIAHGLPVKRFQAPAPGGGRYSSLDPNEMTRAVNRRFDGMVEALEKHTYAEKVRYFEDWNGQLEQELAKLKGPAGAARKKLLAAGGLACRKARSRLVATVLTGMLAPALRRAVDLREQALQRADLTKVCLALSAAKADAGHWPATLDELAPKYLKRVPLDRFTAGPLVYKGRDGGFVLYSKGVNMTDEKGLDERAGPSGADDIAVRVPAGDHGGGRADRR